MTFRQAAALAALAIGLATPAAAEERIWTGVNGRTFRGAFSRLVENGSKAEFVDNQGRTITVALDNLIDDDRARIAPGEQPESAPAQAATAIHRRWQTIDGGTFEGRLIDFDTLKTMVRFELVDGSTRGMARQQLSPGDLSWIDAATREDGGNLEAARRGGTGLFAGFKPEPALDRRQFPIIDQSDFGNKSSDCVPSSFCNFLLWWDQSGFLEIPKRGDYEDKAEWIHTRLARYCGTRNTSGTSFSDAQAGFLRYFEKELEGIAVMRIHRDTDVSPANLSRLTQGSAATMLEMTIRQPPQHDSGHWVALTEASKDGRIVFHTWGGKFEATMKPATPPDGARPQSYQVWDLVIDDPSRLPDWMQTHETTFVLDPANHDAVTVVRAYRYAEEGAKLRPPYDPTMRP